MYKVKDLRVGVAVFLSVLLIAEIYFMVSFFTHGLFVRYGYSMESLMFIPYLLVILLLLSAITISTILIFYGFFQRKEWTLIFSKLFVGWSMIWPIWGILVGLNLVEQILLLLIYLFLILLLNTPLIKEHFVKVFRFGKYTLYKKDVELKSGKRLTIYFFSEGTPKSGTPTTMPEGYRVEVNERSKMPYLKKIRRRRSK